MFVGQIGITTEPIALPVRAEECGMTCLFAGQAVAFAP
jgi:hypothetical protein